MNKAISSFFAAVAVALSVAAWTTTSSLAQERLSFIRDSEIENTIRAYAKPVLDAAELDTDAVRIYIVNSDQLNAFVTGGQRIFVTTGLILATEHPGQLIGVIAHEAGHIAGGHLARLQDMLDRASNQALIAQILGLLVGVGTGQGGAGVAVGLGGAHIAEQNLLAYTRVQEQAADQAAVGFLDSAGISSRGLQEFMRTLEGQELLLASRQDSYARTHPLTRDRIRFIDEHVAKSRASEAKLPRAFDLLHARMRAKLQAFLKPPGHTLQEVDPADDTVAARFARAIAYYRVPDLEKALPLIDELLAAHPNDPYFHEIKGQMLFENGQLREALPSAQEAVRLAPNEPLLRTLLAHVQIELNDPELLKPALANINAALRGDQRYPRAWRLAATAYGRNSDFGMSALALAEYNFLIGRSALARQQAARAERILPNGSPGWLRAQDIKRATEAEPR